MRTIAILTSNDCLASSVTSPQDLFNVANRVWHYLEGDDAAPLFRVLLVSADGNPVRSSSGLLIPADTSLAELHECDFLLIAAYNYDSSQAMRAFVEEQQPIFPHLDRLHQGGCQIGAYCSATFVLAASGLLDQRKATTSWWLERAFRKAYPKAKLEMEELVVEEAGIWTAGATTSYLSLCIKMIERFYGSQIASTVAKVMLVDHNRPSQLPYMSLAEPVVHKDSAISKCQQWLQANLAKAVSLEDMAERSAMSKRNFIRRFKKAVGETPAIYLQRLRIEAAKRYLETTNLKLEQITEKVGYEDASAFRRVFQKLTSLTPTAYRAKFSA